MLTNLNKQSDAKEWQWPIFILIGFYTLFSNAMAVSNIFPGVDNFKNAVLSLLVVIVVIGLVIVLIASQFNGGQINWGQIIGGLLAVVLVGGIAANAENFFKSLGINLQAVGETASSFVW